MSYSNSIIFGPIPSRRFGISLGIDLSPGKKQCNFDCLYCELEGAKTVDKMDEYPSVEDIIKEIKSSFETHSKIDVITLTANGEPTLYPKLDELINEINKIKANTKTLILSNGSTIYKKEIYDALLKIDIVKLSLDCISEKCFKKLDRVNSSVETQKIVPAMINFSKQTKNDLVLEILFVKDLNPDSLHIIKNALVEAAVITDRADVRFQFERQGYFYADPIDYTDEKPVFNKIVGLKDSWAKKTKVIENIDKTEIISKQETKNLQVIGEVTPMSENQKTLFDKYTNEHKLNSEVANILARDEKLSSFYEKTLSKLNSPVSIANIVVNEVAKELKQANELKFTASQIAELIKMVDDEIISNKIAKQIFEEMTQTGVNPSKIVEDKGLVQISDPIIILPIIDEIISRNPDNVEKFKAGNTKLLGFFVGQVLKATGGKANPQVVNELVAEKLK